MPCATCRQAGFCVGACVFRDLKDFKDLKVLKTIETFKILKTLKKTKIIAKTQ